MDLPGTLPRVRLPPLPPTAKTSLPHQAPNARTLRCVVSRTRCRTALVPPPCSRWRPFLASGTQ